MIQIGGNVKLKERKGYTFENFKGVDFSTSPYKVKSTRATQMQNIIYKDGANRKRNGWQSLCKFDGKVNGIFNFDIEGESVILCYAGTRFYIANWNDNKTRLDYTDITETCTYHEAEVDLERLEERRVQVYVNNDKAYIIGCGDYLVFGKWGDEFELRRVRDNEDTYIPTTTVSIDEDEAVNDDEVRDMIDDVNLLSSYRKNKFVGVDKSSGVWTVDTAVKGVVNAIEPYSRVKIELNTLNGSAQITYQIENNGVDKTKLYRVDNNSQVGAIDFVTGKITITINTKPQIEDHANIVVTFKNADGGQVGFDEFIRNATISTIFGIDGNANRVFISGAANKRNLIAWSEGVVEEEGAITRWDYTYFPSINQSAIGSGSSAVMGMVRSSDSTLIILKERNGSDSTIYYCFGRQEEDTIDPASPTTQAKFYFRGGQISDTIYGKHTSANLNGDTLFLTRTGVKGLRLAENISTETYRIQERGRNINGKLLDAQNLTDACACVYDDRYYLAVGKDVYIADSRFTFENEDDISGSFNYEWWYWNNINARVWCEIDGELFFGTNDGLICKFHEGYADIRQQQLNGGNILLDTTESRFNVNGVLYEIHEGDEIEITAGDIYAVFLDDIERVDEEGYIYAGEKSIVRMFDGMKLYAYGDGLEEGVEFEIGNIDIDSLRFKVYTEGEVVEPTNHEFQLVKKVSRLYIADVVDDSFRVKEAKGGGKNTELSLVVYGGIVIAATIIFRQNVLAEWYTPIMDFGTNMYSKTLFNMTISSEKLERGSTEFGYATRNIERDLKAKGSGGFDFNYIDFTNFSFGNSFANSYTHRVKERNFNFMCVRYRSDNQSACAVNSITIRYNINKINKGVR